MNAAGASGTPNRRRGKVATVAVLIVSLVSASWLQEKAYSFRAEAIQGKKQDVASTVADSRVANLDSFSLALLLGGLRGPLVMFLWTSSESQKSERDLESFNTKVELIRLLQPEFDTVTLFQMWNLTYNISVQYSSLANKYAAILDGLDFGFKVDEARPNNINIISEIGRIYGDKLGGSAEKDYYDRRVRTETLPVYRAAFAADQTDAFKKAATDAGLDLGRVRITTDPSGKNASAMLEKLAGDRVKAAMGPAITLTSINRQDLRPKSSTYRRTEMDTLVDAAGNLLPANVQHVREIPAGQEGSNGAKLQYLEAYQPFPYGIPPQALGFNFLKRAQVLQSVNGQRHIYVSDMVIDSQPALAMKFWAEEELARGRRMEERGLANLPPDTGAASSRDLRTAAVAPDAKIADRFFIDDSVFAFERAARVAADAIREFERHIEKYQRNLQNYQSHMDNMKATSHLAAADGKYLRAILAAGPDGRKLLLTEARGEYEQAEFWYRVSSLRYYIEALDAQEIGYVRETVEKKPLAELRSLTTKADAYLARKYKGLSNSPNYLDRVEFEPNFSRIAKRIELAK